MIRRKRITRRNRRHRRIGLQTLECRRVLAASLGWDGPGLGSAELSYYVANNPGSLSQQATNDAIRTALDAWSDVIDVEFTQVDTPGLRDSIDISFSDIDGPAGTLAQAYFPDDVNPARIAGDIQFDISESWEVGNQLGRSAFDLVYVAVHELGHSLGLDHLHDHGSVLEPYVSAAQEFVGLDPSDIAAAQELYAAADGFDTEAEVDDLDENDITDLPTVGDDDIDTDSDSSDDQPDSEGDPFPRRRWRRGGRWARWGRRFNVNLLEHNYLNPTDVNGDNQTSPVDALMVINQISQGFLNQSFFTDIAGLCDTNADGGITPSDALLVINSLETTETDDSETIDDGGLVDESDDDISVDETEDEGLDGDDTTGDETDGEDGDTDGEDTTGDETDGEDGDTDGEDTTGDETDGEDGDTDGEDTTGDETDGEDGDTDGEDTTGDETDGEDGETDGEDTTDDETDGEDGETDGEDTTGDETDGEDGDTDGEDTTGDETDDEDGDTDGEETDDDETDDSECHSHDHSPRPGRLLLLDPTELVSQFDTSEDGLLDSAELSERLWNELIEREADSNDDGFLSAEEIDAVVAAARQEAL